MSNDKFNAEAYWKLRAIKKWVVRLSSSKAAETRYVSAKSKGGAINTAKEVTSLKGNISCMARLATPRDLEARHVG